MSLTILNPKARFECTFGRGCEGVCCRNGRPPIDREEIEAVDRRLQEIESMMRPEAASAVRKDGYLSRRRAMGERMARVVRGWCVFYNQGCVLHRLGAQEDDPFRYKPFACAVFPLSRDQRGRWYVRQRGFKSEKWDLFCLDPAASPAPALESLKPEVELALKAME